MLAGPSAAASTGPRTVCTRPVMPPAPTGRVAATGPRSSASRAYPTSPIAAETPSAIGNPPPRRAPPRATAHRAPRRGRRSPRRRRTSGCRRPAPAHQLVEQDQLQPRLEQRGGAVTTRTSAKSRLTASAAGYTATPAPQIRKITRPPRRRHRRVQKRYPASSANDWTVAIVPTWPSVTPRVVT